MRQNARSVLSLVALAMAGLGAGLPVADEAALSAVPVPVRAQAERSMPRTALPLALVGVMVDSANAVRSACLIRCAYPVNRRSASLLEVGATACDLARVEDIRLDSVVIRNQLTNQLELLPLDQPGRPPRPADAPEPASPVVTATGDVVDVELPKASVDRYLLNLPELLTSAQATPHVRDGAIDGFELTQIKPGSVVEQLGLKNGDVIAEVNGEKLDSLATVMRLFGQVQTTTQARFTVLRGGQRMTFVFNTK